MEKSLWPDVSSANGRAFAFRLASAGAFLLAVAAAAAAVLTLLGFQNVIGYPVAMSKIGLLTLFSAVVLSALTIGVALRQCRALAAWLFAILVLTCFLADAWWGSAAALWLIIVLAVSSLQGVRAVLATDESR